MEYPLIKPIQFQIEEGSIVSVTPIDLRLWVVCIVDALRNLGTPIFKALDITGTLTVTVVERRICFSMSPENPQLEEALKPLQQRIQLEIIHDDRNR